LDRQISFAGAGNIIQKLLFSHLYYSDEPASNRVGQEREQTYYERRDNCSETDNCVGVVDLPLSGGSTASHYTTRCQTDHHFSCFAMYNNFCLTVCLFSQYETISAFILTSVILLNSPLN